MVGSSTPSLAQLSQQILSLRHSLSKVSPTSSSASSSSSSSSFNSSLSTIKQQFQQIKHSIDTNDKESLLKFKVLSQDLLNIESEYKKILKYNRENDNKEELFGRSENDYPITEDGLRNRKGKSQKSTTKPTTSKSSEQEQEKNITLSLLRTKTLLTNEIQRLGLTNEIITNDSKSIKLINEEYINLSDLSGSARKILGSLKNREVKERVALYCSVGFFVLCCFFVVFSRIRIPFLLW